MRFVGNTSGTLVISTRFLPETLRLIGTKPANSYCGITLEECAKLASWLARMCPEKKENSGFLVFNYFTIT